MYSSTAARERRASSPIASRASRWAVRWAIACDARRRGEERGWRERGGSRARGAQLCAVVRTHPGHESRVDRAAVHGVGFARAALSVGEDRAAHSAAHVLQGGHDGGEHVRVGGGRVEDGVEGESLREGTVGGVLEGHLRAARPHARRVRGLGGRARPDAAHDAGAPIFGRGHASGGRRVVARSRRSGRGEEDAPVPRPRNMLNVGRAAYATTS